MGKAKNIVLRPISAKESNALIKRVHYSGKVTQNSQLHIGVFWNGKLEGALQFGPSIDKRRMKGLVKGTEWNEFTELNRMAFTDDLPRNSESRAIAIAFRLLRKHAPHLKWVISFADATQSGDGAIYRASGFVLTGIKKNNQICDYNGRIVAKKSLDNIVVNGKYLSGVLKKKGEIKLLPGYQLRYIYFLDSSCRSLLTVPVVSFSEIGRTGAGMYRGRQITRHANEAT
jgi:hypothetical protein